MLTSLLLGLCGQPLRLVLLQTSLEGRCVLRDGYEVRVVRLECEILMKTSEQDLPAYHQRVGVGTRAINIISN